MAHHFIYLPGVGDHKNSDFQIKAIKKWRKFGLESHFQLIGWNSDESYKSKLNNVIKAVDELYAQRHTVSIVGASAGASLAINVYTHRKSKISKVVLICGKINNPQTLGQNYRENYPALLDCVSASSSNAKELNMNDKQKILTVTPIYDGVVVKEDSLIPGVANKTQFSFVHGIAIGLAITLYKTQAINFIRSTRVQ